MNYVTDNRFITLAADLSESINVEHGTSGGTTIQRPIQLVPGSKLPFRKPAMPPRPLGSSARVPRSTPQQFAGVWALSGTYGAFTPLMYLPARVWSQQNQDSRFRMGVLHILAGHSGPGDRRGCAHALWYLCAAGVEALSAWPGDSSQLLGL